MLRTKNYLLFAFPSFLFLVFIYHSALSAQDLPAGLPPALSGPTEISQPEMEYEKESLSLEEIVNPKVSTASMMPESSLEAPAWIITLTADDLLKRGYSDLSQILDNCFSKYWY